MRILISVLLLICFNVHSFGLPRKPIEHEYLDSIASNFINQLDKRSVSNYIVYTKTKFECVQLDGNVGDGTKSIYIFWEENNSGWVKKISEYYDKKFICLEYENIPLQIDSALKFINEQYKDITRYGNGDEQKVEADKLLYNEFDCNNDFTLEEASVNLKKNKFYFFNYLRPNPNVRNIFSRIRNLISESTPKLKIESKLKPDSLFIAGFLKRLNEEEQYPKQVLKNLVDSSIPISEIELKQLPELEQQAYKLYEYLIENDLFKCIFNEKPDHFKIKYFLVPTVSVGNFSRKRKVKSESDVIVKNKRNLPNFRPISTTKKIEKFLYINDETVKYYRKYYHNNCSLSGIFHTEEKLMSGYMNFIESPPAIKTILFNKKYNEAFIYYQIGTEGINCIIKKKGNDWKLFQTLGIQMYD